MHSKELPFQLEQYFQEFRNNIIGINQEFASPFGKQKIVYTDRTASGRLYYPTEEKMNMLKRTNAEPFEFDLVESWFAY